MVKEFTKLSYADVEILLNAPALISVLASIEGQKINQKEKKDAIELSHLRTFTAEPDLQPYYHEVEKGFKQQFETIAVQHAPFDSEQLTALKNEFAKINEALSRLSRIDKKYALTLHQSLTSYMNHVKKSGRNLLEYFIFPFPVPGITD